jgi:hypothetical protein
MEQMMRNSTWQITSIKEGNAVATVRGVSHENAARAIQNAMYGRDALAEIATGQSAQPPAAEKSPAVAVAA